MSNNPELDIDYPCLVQLTYNTWRAVSELAALSDRQSFPFSVQGELRGQTT